MTVAAVIVCATAESALADAAGRPAVRRMVESAWAGGAVPVVVVAPDGGGAVASALAGSSAVLAEPAPVIGGPVAQIVRGMSVAREQLGDTEAALVWPGRMAWVGPETVTSLIEAHGPDRRSVLRPRFTDQLGWPVLVPLEHLPTLRSLPPEGMPDAL
ncbi:MAG: NTP transferase domain-containing protein, partial [Chloroflexi bacterium]|nr:NTP transferase domain-containing protein [Chloroflexota bacterium]